MFVVMDGEQIQELRQERGLSRPQFAQEAGVSVSTLANLERGANVRLKTARKVGAALEVDPRSLGHSAARA
jgi:transcriptional regulator with XRE-family HTH domain